MASRPWLSEGLSQATLVMIGARDTSTILLIAVICCRAKLCYCSITMQHLINENSLLGILLTLIVHKPDLKLFLCLHSIRINAVCAMRFEYKPPPGLLQCYQEKGEKVYPCTLLHLESTNLHDNPPNLEFCFSRTFYIFD